MNLSPRGQLYVVVVAAAGLLVVGHCITILLASPVGWEWVVLAGLTLLSGSFTIRVPSFQARISVSETFVFTSVLLFGTCAGTLTVALDTLVAALNARRRAREPLRLLFNLSSGALSIWAAAHVFYAMAGIAPLSVAPAEVPELFWPLVAMTTVYFLVNSGLVAAALATERDENAFTIWRKIFPWLSINYFGGASVAALLVSYTRGVDFRALGIIVPLLVISYLTYKTAFRRVEDATVHVDEVNRLYLSTIETLATAIDAKDQVTHGHIRRVQKFALGLARKLGVQDPLQLKALEAAALLHDMGKIAVPEHILNKPSGLTAGEFEKMKLHASVGADILSSIKFPYPVVPIVRHHHESWDGTGYPDGLRGTDIPLGARILAVVDCFDALTSDRPYRPRLSDHEAIEILMKRRAIMYDPLIVDRFIATKDQLSEEIGDGLTTPSHLEGFLRPVLPPSRATETNQATAVSHSVVTKPELRHAVRTVLTAVNQEVACVLSLAYLKDKSRDELITIDALGQNAEILIGQTLPLGSRVSGWVAANGRAIVNSDARLEVPTATGAAKDLICAALPIHFATEIAGVLLVVRQKSLPFTPGEVAYLESICHKFNEPPLRDLLASAASNVSVERSGRRPSVH
jgi:putative nucleotidyltransferase with HDIG domain